MADRKYGAAGGSGSGFAEEDERWFSLTATIEELAGANSQEEVIEILRHSTREVIGAEGIAVVLKDEDKCHYVAEDAKEPLWQGQKFPAASCVSGWAMQHGEPAIIADIEADARVPIEAYRKTFVRSLVMVPIGSPHAFAALGAYWSTIRVPRRRDVAMLEALAKSAATAIENSRLIAALKKVNEELEARIARDRAELAKAREALGRK